MLIEAEDTATRNVDNHSPVTTNSESSDVANESSQKPSIEERLGSKMCSCSRETICLFIAITVSLAFAALQNAPPRVSKPPNARPFFHENSVVLDFYKGQLGSMIERASDTDVSFVMYYAPWDAESQIARHEFERVAHHYHAQIFFAAINCWHPGSECRKQYSKIQSYPVFVLYPLRGPGIQYKGINTAPYMMRFLAAFLKPIRRISNKEDLRELMTQKDAVMVGFFDFYGLRDSVGYTEFYKAAIRALEKDPNQDVIFATVTDVNTAVTEFGIEHTPSARLYLWNESLIYPQDELWTGEKLLKWMDKSIHKVALWLQPPGVKSSTLGPYLSDGPILLLFTPRNPLHPSNYHYDLLREVALQYYTCGDDLTTSQLVQQLKIKRQSAVEMTVKKHRECSELLAASKKKPTSLSISISIQQWINESCCAKVFMNKCLLCEKQNPSEDAICKISPRQLHENCKSQDVFKLQNIKIDSEEEQLCCGDYTSTTESKKKISSIISPENDPYSSTALKMHSISESCLNLLAGNEYHYPVFDDKISKDSDIKLTASACHVNRSLAFIAIDSLQYLHFAEGLGTEILKMRDKTAVVILDSLNESQYLMPENLRLNTLVQFLNNYTEGTVQRTLRSEGTKRHAFDFQTHNMCTDKGPSTICILELNTNTFLQTILDPMKDVIVMYYSPYCAFCSAISYVFLSVARLLSNVEHLSFVRIDGDNNDLPWEYTMNRYPSILFFPAKRKEDSTVFPSSLPIDIPNLLNFILANLEGETHVEALINICYIGSGESPHDCVARIRRVCLDVIQHYLHSYRKLRRETIPALKLKIAKKKREILTKLEHIREIHLILSTVENLHRNEVKYQELLEKFNIYRKNFQIIENHLHEQQIGTNNKKMTKDEL